jgi:hypothetical protein
MNSVLQTDQCSCLDVDRLRKKKFPQPFNYPGVCEEFLLSILKILRGNCMERRVVEE